MKAGNYVNHLIDEADEADEVYGCCFTSRCLNANSKVLC